jgi:lipid-A-disaccharide synthase
MTGADAGRGALRVAVVAGESSGDQLGAGLMAALRALADRPAEFFGVGGPAMEGEGLTSLFPLSETAIMGPLAILTRLPRLLRLVWRTVDAIVAFRPDVLVIIDSPEFTHAVARRVRRRLPKLPVVNYAAPTVWAWRPWRARAMRGYVDRVAAVFPFEPEVYARLGGPPCSYVGHPATERMRGGAVRESEGEKPVLVVLPGSRRSETGRLLPLFGDVVARLSERGRRFEAVVPAVPHLSDSIAAAVAEWHVRARVVLGEEEKWTVFASARAALAASGTVTLELALADVPMVVAYRVDPFISAMKRIFYRPHSVAMANLMLKAPAFPEFVGSQLDVEALVDALEPLFDDGPVRAAQLAALAEVRRVVESGGEAPSRRAARLVLDAAGAGRASATH